MQSLQYIVNSIFTDLACQVSHFFYRIMPTVPKKPYFSTFFATMSQIVSCATLCRRQRPVFYTILHHNFIIYFCSLTIMLQHPLVPPKIWGAFFLYIYFIFLYLPKKKFAFFLQSFIIYT